MSASFYDLLKYAKTGIASPSMTHYDKLKALSMCKAGFPVKTLTGVPPLTFQSDGTALTAWSITGNMTQTGTPTPTVPIQPEETGDKTANLLFEKYESRSINGSGAFTIDNNYDLWLGEVVAGQTYTISNMNYVYGFFTSKPAKNTGVTYNNSRGYTSETSETITVPNGCTWIAVRVSHGADNAMLNTGSTDLPYEPFGYKIPITLAGQTQTVYLGEPLRKIGDSADIASAVGTAGTATRAIKKRILTGQETDWEKTADSEYGYFRLPIGEYGSVITLNTICTHFQNVAISTSTRNIGINVSNSSGLNAAMVAIRPNNVSAMSIENFKQWLSEQYAAGTPVCIWYVLSEPTTETFDAPTITPQKGANTLTVGTTLPPSEVSITGGIK